MKKKVFISYAWKTDESGRVLELAEKLISDGVDVKLDKWDLKPGQDKYAFMESMVLDTSIDKVLIICDSEYTKKADNRDGGVGDETVIISSRMYQNTKQEKFIPIVFERDENGKEFMPIYIANRIYIDLSNNDLNGGDYEQLLRHIYDEPRYIKPDLGVKPNFNGPKQTTKADSDSTKKIYMGYINSWCELIDINNWNSWTSFMFGSGQPRMSKEIYTNLEKLQTWFLSRIWPKTYPELDAAFENFMAILRDLYSVFSEHAVDVYGMLTTEKFYKIDKWDDELYRQLHKEFEYHVYLVEDLVLELTRAVNYVCDKVREYIMPSFRIEEGLALITYGPCSDFTFKTRSVNYQGDERTLIPYKGLEDFKQIRGNRDFCFGAGTNINDPKFLEWYGQWR